jgi:RNA polymerase sigma-70 factor (ECF subfamily)
MDRSEITRLLKESSEGNRAAMDALLPLVYADLRRIAGGYLRRQAPGHTLQPTALLHEAYLKLFQSGQPDWRDRTHFFAVSASAMRQILVDHARSRNAVKRGGDAVKVSLDESFHYAPERPSSLIALDDALKALAAFDERKARVLELRYFGGLGIDEIASTIGVSVATIGRELRFAEAWLRTELLGDSPSS